MKNQGIKRLNLAVVVVVLLVFSSPGLGLTASLPKEVKIGVILPLTGPVAAIGNSCQRGVMMAVDHINNEGGLKSLNGAKIKVFWGDDEAKPEVSISEVERMIGREKVDLLIGSFTSACSFPITQVAERNKIPIIVPSSGKDEITERGFKYTFRQCEKAQWIGAEQVDFIKWLSEKTDVSVNTLALLYEDSGWGQTVARSVKEIIPKAGYKLVADLSYPARDTKDFRSTILKLKGASPDVVIQVAYTMDAILITKMMHALQFDCKGIVATGTGHTTQEYHDAVGELAEYLIAWDAWSPAIPLDEVKLRAKEFKEKYNKLMDQFVAWFYDAVYVAAKAFNEAGSVEKTKVRDALSNISLEVGEKGNLHLFEIVFDENGQNPNAKAVYSQVLNGKMTLIKPERWTSAKPVFPVPPWAKR